MREWRSSTAAIRCRASGPAVRTCRGGSWWRATTAHVHRRRPTGTTASWPWPVRVSSWRGAALTVAIVVLSAITSLVVAAVFIVAIVALVLVVLWLIVLLGARPTRILSLWRRSWVCHL